MADISTTPTEQAQDPNSVTITLDGVPTKAVKGEMLIRSAERAGNYIPHFCYHPRMKPVGMCRMCLVEVKGPRGFSLQPACFIAASEGQEVITNSDKVKKAQEGVIEFLLVNHPLDCPVCDKGGECPLQDQTVAFGPGESRFVEEKRHWEKPIVISELVLLDRERCIQCGRCTRFAQEIGGDPLIDFVGRGDHIEVSTFPNHPFSSYFSGNTVQICPVGALTSKSYRFKARPWDLSEVETTCKACSFGCRISIQSSVNRIIRNVGIDSDPVNQSWLCDKGRYNFDYLNSAERLRAPLVKKNGQFVETTWGEALSVVSEGIKKSISLSPDKVAILGGAQLANEDIYAWAKLAKSVIGTDSLDAQLGDGLPAKALLSLPRATIDEACSADLVILLAPDLKEELPVLYLRLNQAATKDSVPIIEISSHLSGMTPYVKSLLSYLPGEAAIVAKALVDKDERFPYEDDLSQQALTLSRSLLETVGSQDFASKKIVVILGRPSLAESAEGIIEAAHTFMDAFPQAKFLPALRRANVMGALEMGFSPGLLPGRVSLDKGGDWYRNAWGSVPTSEGKDARGILSQAQNGQLETLVLLGADPIVDFPDAQLAKEALQQIPFVVAVDIFLNESSKLADVVLPAAAFGERSGTTTNIEGRVSRVAQKVVPPGLARPDWMIASQLSEYLGRDLGFDSLESIWDEIQKVAPLYEGVSLSLLGSAQNKDGIIVPLAITSGQRPAILELDTLRATTRRIPFDAYSLRLISSRRLYDQGTLTQHSQFLANLGDQGSLQINPSDLKSLGIISGGQVRVRSSRSSLVLNVVPNQSIPRGSAWLGFNLIGSKASDLIDAFSDIIEIRLETP